MNDGSSRSFDGEGKRVDNRMRDVKELHSEARGGDLVLVFDSVEVRLFEHSVLLQLVLYERHRKAGAVQGNIQVRKNKRKRADVILVAVCQEDRLNFTFVFEEVSDIGNNDVEP